MIEKENIKRTSGRGMAMENFSACKRGTKKLVSKKCVNDMGLALKERDEEDAQKK